MTRDKMAGSILSSDIKIRKKSENGQNHFIFEMYIYRMSQIRWIDKECSDTEKNWENLRFAFLDHLV